MRHTPLGRALERLDRVFQTVNALLVALALFLMFAVVLAVIVLRYGFGVSIFWGEELARYAMIYMALLGAAVALRSDQHPKLTVFWDMLPLVVRAVLGPVKALLLAVTIAVLFWHGLDVAIEEGIMRTPALRMEYFWVFLAIPIGAAAMLVQLLARQAFPARYDINDGDAP